jgi:O-antigen ligase
VLFRASFFVTGFIFPLACSIVTASATMLFPSHASRRRRIAYAVSVAINVLALALMGNSTAAVGVTVGLACAAMVLSLWPRGLRRIVLAALIGAVLASLVFWATSRVMSPAQLQLLLGRASDNTSFLERLTVWHNVLAYIVNAPHAALVGLGPDTSIRLHDHPLLQDLFRGGGVQQEAVDSGYLYVLLNYGGFAFGLVCLIALAVVADLVPAALVHRDLLGALLLCLVVTWAVMSITQMHGVSKPAFMLMQLLALAECVPSTRVYPRVRGLAAVAG